MSAPLEPELRELCDEVGIVPTYRDGMGEEVVAPRESILAALSALGFDSAGERAREARRQLARSRVERAIEPVIVAFAGELTEIRHYVRTAATVEAFVVAVTLEGGKTLTSVARVVQKTRDRADPSVSCLTLRVRLSLPLGYHELELRTPAGIHRAMVIAAPGRAPRPNRRAFGLFAPAYSLRSERAQASGTLAELGMLMDVSAQLGASFVGVLPMLAQYLDHPFDSSPFAPASRLYWNEALLDVFALPELATSSEAREALDQAPFASLDQNAYARFRERMSWLDRVLVPASKSWARAPERDVVLALEQRAPDVRTYANFRALVETYGEPSRWSEGVRAMARRAEGGDGVRATRHLYAQLRMDEQLSGLVERSRSTGVRLYMDLPLGVHRESYDAFVAPDCFVAGLTVGAPPDALARDGQNWGFSPMHPVGQREQRYRYFARMLRTQLRYAGMLRLDHVMGLHRVFAIPEGASAADGVYLAQPFEELYAVLLLEAHRAQATLIGEDLGVVPDAVRRTMRQHGLLRMSVLPFELDTFTRKPSALRGALASLNTHDMPSFAALVSGGDIDERQARGALDSADALAERTDRAELVSRLRKAVGVSDKAPLDATLEAAVLALAESDAELVLIALEDLWLEQAPQNVPGTFDPERNFCRRMELTVEQIARHEGVRNLLRKVRAAREEGTSPTRTQVARTQDVQRGVAP